MPYPCSEKTQQCNDNEKPENQRAPPLYSKMEVDNGRGVQRANTSVRPTIFLSAC